MQGLFSSDSLLYLLVAYAMGQIGFSFFVPKGARTRFHVFAWSAAGAVVFLTFLIYDFASGVSTRDRIVAAGVCSVWPSLGRCIEIEESKPTHSEADVRKRAVQWLVGDPYGRFEAEVLRNITRVRYTSSDLCGSGKNWIISVYVPAGAAGNNQPISGELYFDDVSGDFSCWSLPYLD